MSELAVEKRETCEDAVDAAGRREPMEQTDKAGAGTGAVSGSGVAARGWGGIRMPVLMRQVLRERTISVR